MKMHRYRRQAHNAAWYDKSGDASGVPPIPLKNPFATIGGGSRRSPTVVEEEVVIRRHVRSSSPARSRSQSIKVPSLHESLRAEERRSPRRETVEIAETRRSHSRTRIIAEERVIPEPEDDLVEVLEEHSPVRRVTGIRADGWRTVDPSWFGGGRRESKGKTTRGRRPETSRQSPPPEVAIVEVLTDGSPVGSSKWKSTWRNLQETGIGDAVAAQLPNATKEDEAIDDSTSPSQNQESETVSQRLRKTTKVDLEACSTSSASHHTPLNALRPYLTWLPSWRQGQEASDNGPDLLASHLDAADRAFEAMMARRKTVAVLRFDLGQRSVRSTDAQLERTRDGTVSVSTGHGASEEQAGPGLNLIYALDSDDVCEEFLDRCFPFHDNEETWLNFRQWAATSHSSRGGKKKVKAWKSFSPREPRSASFAFGFEHPGPFMAAYESQSSVKLIQAVHDAKRRGVYSTSRFSKFENQRRIVFIDLAAQSVEDGRDTYSYERTVTISHNRPCHLEGSEPTPIDLADVSVWKRLIDRIDDDLNDKIDDDGNDSSYLSYSDDEEARATTFQKENLKCFRVLKAVLFGVVAATIETWNVDIDQLDEQFAALEARVYANPSNDAPATDLWALSKHLLGMQQSLLAHVGMMQSMQDTLNKYAYDYGDLLRGSGNTVEAALWRSESQEPWLEESMQEMTDMAKSVEEDQIQHAGQMIDLLYKSVSIRDARLSLDLNASLWRLSWITFIFLPLTFLVGFFGMNVSVFVNNGTSLKWYFIAAVPLMLLILIAWLLFKHFVSRNMNKNRMGKDFSEKKDN